MSASFAWDVNVAGEIVGTVDDGSTSRPYAALWQSDRTAVVLEEALLGSPGWQLHDALSINDNGYIVGKGLYLGQRRGFLLIPVPEPPLGILFVSGIGALGALTSVRKFCYRFWLTYVRRN